MQSTCQRHIKQEKGVGGKSPMPSTPVIPHAPRSRKDAPRESPGQQQQQLRTTSATTIINEAQLKYFN